MSQIVSPPPADHTGRARKEFRGQVLLCGIILSLPLAAATQQPGRMQLSKGSDESTPAMAQARRDYETRCSSCHGLDGRGGEHAPNISTAPAIVDQLDHDIFTIVHDGRPSKGMPTFDYLGETRIKSLVSYLRAMGRRSGWVLARGNPQHGEELFFGKAGCGNCHMMEGKGGFLGADLTKYVESHSPAEAKEAILNPGKFRDPHQETLAVVTREGERISGVVRNEDNFSLQLQGTDGAFHNIMKSDVERVDQSGGPAMHACYGQNLAASEIDDLVCYLGRSARPTENHGKKPINRLNN